MLEKNFWQGYNRFYHHCEKSVVYQNFLKDLESLVNPRDGEIWLDVGCGAGRIVSLLKNKSGDSLQKIIGVDIDENVLLLAHQKFSQEIQKNKIELLNIDFSKKTFFKDRQFDGITANFVLPYITVFENRYTGKMAIEMLMREVYRILNPSGIFIWSMLKRDFSLFKIFWNSRKNIFSCAENLYYAIMILTYLLRIKKKNKIILYHALSRDEIDVLLKRIGFRNIIYKESLINQALIIKAEK